MKRPNQIIGLIWIALGSGMAIEGINLGLGSPHLPGTGFVPFIVGGLLGVCGLILTVWVTVHEKENGSKLWWEYNWKNPAFSILGLFMYALLMEHLGFLMTTFIFQFFLLKLTEPRKWLSPLFSSFLIAVSCYLGFSVWLKVPLPRGFWGLG